MSSLISVIRICPTAKLKPVEFYKTFDRAIWIMI